MNKLYLFIPIQLMIATHTWVKTRFIASLQMVYLSHYFLQLALLIYTMTLC